VTATRAGAGPRLAPAGPPGAAWRGWLGSLKARMALVLGLVLVLPAAYAAFQAVAVYDAQSARQGENLRRTAGLISRYEGDLLAQAKGAVEQLAGRPDLRPDDPAACARSLAEARSRDDRLTTLLVADAQGRVACAAPDPPAEADVGAAPWFAEARDNGGVAVGDGRAGAGRAVLLAAPLRQDGRFAGAVAAGLDPVRLAGVAGTTELPQGTVAYLADRAGRLLGPADPAALTLPDRDGLRELLAGPDQVATVDGPGGRMGFVAAPIVPGRLYALVGLPSPRWSWLERDLVLGLIAPVLMLAVAVIGIWIATDFLVNRHVEALASAARAYAAGRPAAWPSLRGAPSELRQLAAVLARTSGELGAREDELKASLGQKEALLREVHHRVKNNLQVVTSLLNLRAQAATSPAARAAMLEAQARIKALALVHRGLYEGEEPGTAEVELQSFLGELCNLLEDTVPGRSGEVEVRLDLQPARVAVDRAVPIALFVTEALSNAFKHAFPGGRRGTVAVRLARVEAGGATARLTVRDDGVGIGPEATPGLGTTLMRMLAGQTGGRLRMDSRDGTLVELEFPLAPGRAAGARAA
jgi:two-component sensor histidine kinase